MEYPVSSHWWPLSWAALLANGQWPTGGSFHCTSYLAIAKPTGRSLSVHFEALTRITDSMAYTVPSVMDSAVVERLRVLEGRYPDEDTVTEIEDSSSSSDFSEAERSGIYWISPT